MGKTFAGSGGRGNAEQALQGRRYPSRDRNLGGQPQDKAEHRQDNRSQGTKTGD